MSTTTDQRPATNMEESAPAPPPAETSNISRWVAALTPVLAVFASWLAGAVAQLVPGAHLDANQITALMVAAATAAVGAAWKWLEGSQRHERLVAERTAPPVPPGDRDRPADT